MPDLYSIAREVDAGAMIMPANVRWLLDQLLEQQKEIVCLQDMLIQRNGELIDCRQMLFNRMKNNA